MLVPSDPSHEQFIGEGCGHGDGGDGGQWCAECSIVGVYMCVCFDSVSWPMQVVFTAEYMVDKLPPYTMSDEDGNSSRSTTEVPDSSSQHESQVWRMEHVTYHVTYNVTACDQMEHVTYHVTACDQMEHVTYHVTAFDQMEHII